MCPYTYNKVRENEKIIIIKKIKYCNVMKHVGLMKIKKAVELCRNVQMIAVKCSKIRDNDPTMRFYVML